MSQNDRELKCFWLSWLNRKNRQLNKIHSIFYSDKWFEHRIISYLFGVIVQVKVVFRKTVVGDYCWWQLITNNSLSKDYPHPDDHAKQIFYDIETDSFQTIWRENVCHIIINLKQSVYVKFSWSFPHQVHRYRRRDLSHWIYFWCWCQMFHHDLLHGYGRPVHRAGTVSSYEEVMRRF